MTTIATIEEILAGPVTQAEGESFVRGLIATAPAPIPLATLNTPGTPESAIVYALGAAEAQRSLDRQLFAQSGFRGSCSRAWLDVVAPETYGVTPRAKDFATTPLTIENTSGALYGPFIAGTLRFVNDVNNAIFTNTVTASIPIGPSTVGIDAIAIEAGIASTSSVGDISRLETPLEGVSVTNLQPAIGTDAESAESINDRIDARLGAFGVPGAGFATGATDTALESLAKNGFDNGGGVARDDGSRIVVSRSRVELDGLTGVTTLYLADDDGPLDGSDLLLVEALVQAYGEWVTLDIAVANTTAVSVTVDGTITIRGAAATDAQILAQIDVELIGASRACPIHGFPPSNGAPLRYVENAVENAGDAGKLTAFRLVDIVLSSPTGATSLAENEVLVLARGTITIVRV